MTENADTSFISRLETFLKFATPIGAIVAFLVGVYHYQDTRVEEFRKEFWEKRYELYRDITDLTGRIAHTTDPELFSVLSREFLILFHGESVLLEDKHVFHAMESFGASLPTAVIPDSLIILQKKSTLLGRACRLSLKETWEPVPVKELEAMDE